MQIGKNGYCVLLNISNLIAALEYHIEHDPPRESQWVRLVIEQLFDESGIGCCLRKGITDLSDQRKGYYKELAIVVMPYFWPYFANVFPEWIWVDRMQINDKELWVWIEK